MVATFIGVQLSFDAVNDAVSIFLNCSVAVSSAADCCRSKERQFKMLLAPSDSWAGGVAVSNDLGSKTGIVSW